MTVDTNTLMRIRRENDVAVVNFLTPYLQTDDVIKSVGDDLTRLVDEQGYTKVLLSFTGVRFLSSAMLAQMVKLQRKMVKLKGRVRLSALPPAMREVMHVSQLDQMLEVFDDEPTALAQF